ncbi:host specificity protein [Epibacterium sp. SM1979]|uniref:Host specificity protein n=1 Tax=Tritonibacter litoralis TaxID=2662264 RepID=A0A843YD23_9RHOB|nr:glycoside hydrolase/phage tail family protein [Tritonibacter litoralis]MQQ06959.1 host specificity protein [Tritonibacter litoralis]
MATILLSAAGAALGGAAGGTVLGLSTAVVGRAVGATLGRAIDERLLGRGGQAVEMGRVDRFRLSEAVEGAPIARLYGRMRLGGQVIWASDFVETTTTTGGGSGKGAPRQPTVTQYSYSVSLAIAVCEGEVLDIPRVWADGEEIAPKDVNLRWYAGSRDQLPDPLIEAVEGAGKVPAYRGTAYVVIEDLQLDRFGNRVPQFSFEVVRAAQPDQPEYDMDLPQLVEGVALVPGTGEYALATSPVWLEHSAGERTAINSHSHSGETDLVTSVATLGHELPRCGAVSLVVSWFGGDLRCGHCAVEPKVEQGEVDGSMPWTVSGLTREDASVIAQADARPIYGGTPADASVIEAIQHLRAQGKAVMFYPFILMDQQLGNELPDPWSEAASQAHLPWRGRITLSVAPGRAGSPDQTATADAEVAAFVGTARAADFLVAEGTVTYSGPDEWSFSRFILHYAALCAAAGGVDSFCIGSELRALTQIRGAEGFPFVAALQDLLAEVRTLLGADVKLGYAADWSEYWGYTSPEEDRYFHLDPLWADPELDFIGIDNYMPLSDWREGRDHLDAAAGVPAIYDLDYLQGNVAGGEGFDWFYHSPEAEAAQIRTAITDGAYDEPWVFRYKDIRAWWENAHHNRIDGVRQTAATDWLPQSKPIWFTELGCAAIDKGTNQPNKFLDPKSSESQLPKFSNGQRDDLIQIQYLRAMYGYWSDAQNNPVSAVYGAPMLDMSRAFVWAWDARPFPVFPNALEVWSDGENYPRGHWLNGRIGQRPLAEVVTEICAASDVQDVDASGLYDVVRGFLLRDVETGRSELQPLMLRHGFDAIERDGVLQFRKRQGVDSVPVAPDHLVVEGRDTYVREDSRDGAAELTGRVRLRFAEWGGDHKLLSEEAVLPDEATHAVSQNELPLALTRAEARLTVERWLAEARMARDTVRLTLPLSLLHLGAGDVVDLGGDSPDLFRIDRATIGAAQEVEAVRIAPEVYRPARVSEDLPGVNRFAAPVPVLPLFLDLPLLRGDEVPHAPHLAVTATPWPGSVAVYGSAQDQDYLLEEVLAAPATVGETESILPAARPGRWDLGPALQLRLYRGALQSLEPAAVLNGGNVLAIGDGSAGGWEVLQFAEAELIAPQTYLLRSRLRGQAGSEVEMLPEWPVGSRVVLLDGVPGQVDLSPDQRRMTRHYRIGSARRGYEDPSYVHRVESFEGKGLRPLAPVHLRQSGDLGGEVTVRWIRRTRVGGDPWDGPEVPLGEEREAYRVRILRGAQILREEEVSQPSWSYSTAAQAADGVVPGDRVEVAQISALWGAGAAAIVGLG